MSKCWAQFTLNIGWLAAGFLFSYIFALRFTTLGYGCNVWLNIAVLLNALTHTHTHTQTHTQTHKCTSDTNERAIAGDGKKNTQRHACVHAPTHTQAHTLTQKCTETHAHNLNEQKNLPPPYFYFLGQGMLWTGKVVASVDIDAYDSWSTVSLCYDAFAAFPPPPPFLTDLKHHLGLSTFSALQEPQFELKRSLLARFVQEILAEPWQQIEN